MLLIRGSAFTKARAILKDTLHGLKSLFSTGYQRLPKTPPFSAAFSCGGNERQLHRSFRELDNFYDGFSQQQWETSTILTSAIDEKKKKLRRRRTTGKLLHTSAEEKTGLVGGERSDIEDSIHGTTAAGSFMGFARICGQERQQQQQQKEEAREDEDDMNRNIVRRSGASGKEELEGDDDSFCRNLRVEVCCTVAEGLRKLEQLDASNVEHVLDIEEVLHYYSRIKCPFYLDIFNNFFIETYSEFLPPSSSATCRFCRRP